MMLFSESVGNYAIRPAVMLFSRQAIWLEIKLYGLQSRYLADICEIQHAIQ